MDEEKIIGKIEKSISSALKKQRKVVVGIDGYTGIGKTTILNALVKQNRKIIAINRDDFLKSRRSFEKIFKEAKDKSKALELDILNERKIRKLVGAFRKGEKIFQTNIFDPKTGKVNIAKKYNLAKNLLVIEGIFLFHQKQLNDIFDLRIFLDGSIADADARRIKREKKKWGKDYFPESHPDSYFRIIKIAFQRYLKEQKPKNQADLVLKV
jgi:uridine kinase